MIIYIIIILLLFSCVPTRHVRSAAEELIKLETTCIDSLPEGPFQLSRERDNVFFLKAVVFNGKAHGELLSFSSLGDTIAVWNLYNGVLDGTAKMWYLRNGYSEKRQLKLIATYSKGLLHGQKTSWYPNGKIRSEFNYLNDNLIQGILYRPDGNISLTQEMTDQAYEDKRNDMVYLNTILDRIYDNLYYCKDQNGPIIRYFQAKYLK
jgi:antitoxin component YwqK of YwqJK toxin-antitoxin module